MQEINLSQLDQLGDKFDRLLKEFPEKRKAYHVKVGNSVLQIVRRNLGGSGKVQAWQENYVGTWGGYAAVRPMRKTEYKGYAVGYITNSIESGHKIRQGGGKRTRRNSSYVLGKHFYMQSEPESEAEAIREAERLVNEMSAVLEG